MILNAVPKRICDLPKKIGNYKLRIETYEDLEREGFSKKEVDGWYDTDGNIAKMYSYAEDGDEGGESVLVGIQLTDGTLSVYGCRTDCENISEQRFCDLITNPYYFTN